MYSFEIDLGPEVASINFNGDIKDIHKLTRALKKGKLFHKIDGDRIFIIPTSKILYVEIQIKKG